MYFAKSFLYAERQTDQKDAQVYMYAIKTGGLK